MRLNLGRVIPGRGCVVGVVGLCCACAAMRAGSQKYSVLGECGWDAGPERVRVL